MNARSRGGVTLALPCLLALAFLAAVWLRVAPCAVAGPGRNETAPPGVDGLARSTAVVEWMQGTTTVRHVGLVLPGGILVTPACRGDSSRARSRSCCVGGRGSAGALPLPPGATLRSNGFRRGMGA